MCRTNDNSVINLAFFDTASWSCVFDGNLDNIVNQKDVDGWNTYSVLNGGQSSWSDFNFDGKTDNTDLGIIYKNWQTRCTQR